MKKVAFLIDGAFLRKVFKERNGEHITKNEVLKVVKESLTASSEEIFRVYYYDAPPFEDELQNPIDGKGRRYFPEKKCSAINNFHNQLAEANFVAFRKGTLSFNGWKINKWAMQKIVKGKILKATDIIPNFKQKTVDMKIGLDIAWLASKRIVDKIVLITADNDFIPRIKKSYRIDMK